MCRVIEIFFPAGTQVCNDKDRQLIAILLTNRVYPVASDESEDLIHAARIAFSDLIVSIFDASKELVAE